MRPRGRAQVPRYYPFEVSAQMASSHDLAYWKNMVPPLYTLRLKGWPRSCYLPKRWMDLDMNAHEAPHHTGWAEVKRRMTSQGLVIPVAHFCVKLEKIQECEIQTTSSRSL